MIKRNIIVVGASAGGVNALVTLVKALPPDFAASIFIVMHLHPSTPSTLPLILTKEGGMKALHAQDNEPIQEGKIYIAPPDHHMLLEKDRILVRRGPKENRFRPSIDALFRSAAYIYGSRVIGIILSGMLNDGTSGMWSVKRMGGVGIIQDPADALFDSMPVNVLEFVEIDYSVPISEMGEVIIKLVNEQAAPRQEVTAAEMERMKMEVVVAAHHNAFEMGILHLGKLTPFTCPECHGSLIKLEEGKTVRFRCHTGHAFTASTLLSGLTQNIEDQLWSVMRALEEATMLLEHIAQNFSEVGNAEAAREFQQKADESRKRSVLIHENALNQKIISEDLRHRKGDRAVIS